MLWRSRDLLNLGAIKVLDPVSNRWISVECTWPAYAEGTTHRQHRITVDQLNAKGKRINEENLLAAMNAIHHEIDDIKAGVKRSGQMKDIARFEDSGPKPQNMIEPSQYDPTTSAEPISAGLRVRTTRVRRSKATNPTYGPGVSSDTSSSASPKTDAQSASPTTLADGAEAGTPNPDSQTIGREARAKAFRDIKDL